jgi:hypothetical protein
MGIQDGGMGDEVKAAIKDLDQLETRVEPLEEPGVVENRLSGGPVLSIVMRCASLEGLGMNVVPAELARIGGTTAGGTTAGGTTAGGTTAGGTTAGGTTAGGTTAGGTTAGGTTAGGTTAGGTTAGGTTAGGTTAGGTTAGGTTAGGTTAGGTTAGGARLDVPRGAGIVEFFVDLSDLEALELRIVSPARYRAEAGTAAGGTTAGGTTAGGTTAASAATEEG